MTDDPRKVREAADELRAAVSDLCEGRKTKVIQDDGTIQHGTVPSLWDQACQALADSKEGTTRGSAASRPPYDLDLADCLNDIRQSVRWECAQRRLAYREPYAELYRQALMLPPVHGPALEGTALLAGAFARARSTGPRTVHVSEESLRAQACAEGDLLANLRQIVEHEATAGQVNVLRLWTFKVTDWARGLASRLGQLDGRAAPIRDSTCPNCGQSHVVVTDADDWSRVEPALILPTPPLPVAVCRACGQQWSDRDGLFDLAYGIENVRDAAPRRHAEQHAVA